MKKVLLSLIALLTLSVATTHASDWTIETSLGPVLYTSYDVVSGLTIQKVGCYNPRSMCYTESEMKRVFYVDIASVEKTYVDVTGKQPVWQYLATLLK